MQDLILRKVIVSFMRTHLFFRLSKHIPRLLLAGTALACCLALLPAAALAAVPNAVTTLAVADSAGYGAPTVRLTWTEPSSLVAGSTYAVQLATY